MVVNCLYSLCHFRKFSVMHVENTTCYADYVQKWLHHIDFYSWTSLLLLFLKFLIKFSKKDTKFFKKKSRSESIHEWAGITETNNAFKYPFSEKFKRHRKGNVLFLIIFNINKNYFLFWILYLVTIFSLFRRSFYQFNMFLMKFSCNKMISTNLFPLLSIGNTVWSFEIAKYHIECCCVKRKQMQT